MEVTAPSPLIAVEGGDSLAVVTVLDTLPLFLDAWFNDRQDTASVVIVERKAGLGDTLRFHFSGRGWKTNPVRTMELNRMFVADTLALWFSDGPGRQDSVSDKIRVLRKTACALSDFGYRIDTLRVLMAPAKAIRIVNGR
jgi:hypothetical protein